MATKYSLPERLDVWNPFVEGDHGGQTPEEQNKDGDDDQSPDSNAQRGGVEIVKGCPGSNVYKTGHVEEKVDNGTEHGFLGLPVEETIPSKSSAATERSKEVISAEHRASADYQKSEGDVLSYVGLTIYEVSSLAELHEVPETVTEDGAINGGKQYLIWRTGGKEMNEITKMNV